MADQNQLSAELMQQINFEMERYGKLTQSTADALRDAQVGVKGFSDAVRKAPKALGDAAGSMAEAMYKGTQGAAAYNKAVDSMAEAASNAVTVLQAMIPGGPVVKALVAGLAYLTKGVIKAAAETEKLVAVQGDALFKSYQKLSAAGAVAAGGTTELGQSLYKMGLSFEEADQMIQQFSENSQDLALFGGSVYKGAQAMANVVDAAKPLRVQLESLGLNQQAQNEAIMGYIKVQTRLGNSSRLQAQGFEATAAAAARYIAEQDALTKVTGISRKEQEKALDEAMRNARFAATVDMMRAQGQDKAADQLTFVMQAAGKLGPQFQKGMTDLVNGIPDSDEAAAVLRSTGGEALKLINMVTSGQIQDQKQMRASFQSLIDATAQTTKGLQPLYKFAGDSKSFVAYSEGRRAFEMASDKVGAFAKAMDEAEEETQAQLSGADKRTRTQADTAVKQRQAMLYTQQTADLAIDTSVTAVNKLATAAEAAAKALYLLTHKEKEQEKAVAANSPALMDLKDALEKEKDAYADATVLQEIGIGRTKEQIEATEAVTAARQEAIKEQRQQAASVAQLPPDQQAAARETLSKQAIGAGLPPGVKPPAMPDANRLPGQPRPAPAPAPAPAAAVKPYTPAMGEYLKKIAQTESAGKREALPPVNKKTGQRPSSAAGLFQFTEETWQAQVKAMGKDYSLQDRFDPKKAAEVAAFLSEQNRKQLIGGINLGKGQKIAGMGDNYQPTDADLYMAHFLGAGGALKFLKAMQTTPNAPAADNVQKRQAEANPNIFFIGFKNYQDTPVDRLPKRSLAEVYDLMSKKLTRSAQQIAQGETTEDVLALADGGIVKAKKGGTRAIVGEAGVDEAFIPLKNGAVPVTMNLEGLAKLIPTAPMVTQTSNDTGQPLQILPKLPIIDGAVPVTIKSNVLSSLVPTPDTDQTGQTADVQNAKDTVNTQFRQMVMEITNQLQNRGTDNSSQELIGLMQEFVRGQRQMISNSGRLLQVAQN